MVEQRIDVLDLTKEIEFAARLAREASTIVNTFYVGSSEVRYKLHDEPVTEADRSANQHIVTRIQTHFPEDGILSEESKDDLARLQRDRVWIVDPLDGTKEFIARNGEFSIMIGLVVAGAPVMGVIMQPTSNLLYIGAVGYGAYLHEDGEEIPLSVSTCTDLSQMIMVSSRSHRQQIVDRVRAILRITRERVSGSVGLKVGLISRRLADVYIHPSPGCKEWDLCAPQALLEAAGGRMTDCWGNPIRYNRADVRAHNGVVATNGLMHDEIIGVVAGICADAGYNEDDGFLVSRGAMTQQDQFDHTTYLSPLTWRYGGAAMRRVWSEVEKRRLLRQFWVALAEAQCEAGLVTPAQVADLRQHQDDIDIVRATAIEQEIRHDLMAEIRTYAEQCPVGGAVIHLGATSMDALDNVDALRLRTALALVIAQLEQMLAALATRIEAEAATPAIAFTHIQPAEPTTVGYRLAQYGQDLLLDLRELRRVHGEVRGKGLKGAVGTSASYADLLAGTGWEAHQLEAAVMARLGLDSFPVATQTYPRKQDWLVLNALAGVCASLHKFAFDLRLLQSPPFGEWSEPFGAKQVGSSAMPFKRNPIGAENIDSLTRLVAALPAVAWENAALSLLERTLDDSANRRLVLPEAFLLTDEALTRATRLAADMQIWPAAVARNLHDYGLFAATERVLMAAVRAGGNRQALHEVIREHSLAAWAALQAGAPNPLVDLLAGDVRITALVPATELPILMDASAHVGHGLPRPGIGHNNP